VQLLSGKSHDKILVFIDFQIIFFLATFLQLKKPNQQLLIPLTVFIGMEQAFIGADFTQVN
jgi:hypothetical protein